MLEVVRKLCQNVANLHNIILYHLNPILPNHKTFYFALEFSKFV